MAWISSEVFGLWDLDASAYSEKQGHCWVSV